MVEEYADIKGTEDFLIASDEFYKYLAAMLRQEIKDKTTDIERLRDLSDIVKINCATIKSQEKSKKEKKEKDRLQFYSRKNKQAGDQVAV